jgi:hypothetical protein
MDSSRGGLLSTLLMTLPLIVVPAVALLRQPGMMPGVSQTPLDASDSDESLGDAMVDDIFGTDDSSPPSRLRPRPSASAPPDEDVDSLFTEVPDEKMPDFDREASPADPFEDNSTSGSGDARRKADRDGKTSDKNPDDLEPPAQDDSAADHVRIIKQLESEGALRTLWFEPSATHPVGLAVFFRGQTELVRIRFEAVGPSRDACALDVLQQVQRWRQEQQDAGR